MVIFFHTSFSTKHINLLAAMLQLFPEKLLMGFCTDFIFGLLVFFWGGALLSLAAYLFKWTSNGSKVLKLNKGY